MNYNQVSEITTYNYNVDGVLLSTDTITTFEYFDLILLLFIPFSLVYFYKLFFKRF